MHLNKAFAQVRLHIKLVGEPAAGVVHQYTMAFAATQCLFTLIAHVAMPHVHTNVKPILVDIFLHRTACLLEQA